MEQSRFEEIKQKIVEKTLELALTVGVYVQELEKDGTVTQFKEFGTFIEECMDEDALADKLLDATGEDTIARIEKKIREEG